ncbi:hypothetical protein [Deinococcus radiotolerans]|uniref:hypothetical protein n=1 Tax=Deinococcus radiotolerans TaxID=1309407 RepID=UPI00166811CE|nr:hypothetical protein [Deinococcus radiotolerans]
MSSLVRPVARAAPLITGQVLPLAGPSFNHVEGGVRVRRLTITDLNGLTWWAGALPWRAVQRDATQRYQGQHGTGDTTHTRR